MANQDITQAYAELEELLRSILAELDAVGRARANIAVLKDIHESLDAVARARADIAIMYHRVLTRNAHDPDKTPVRPPSSTAMEAFRTSSTFKKPVP